MLETQIIEVSENEKGKVIDFYQTFGWHVLQTQKIDYTTTYMTGGGNARDGYRYTVHNDRTAYYSITFQRETKEINAEKEKLFKKYTSNRNQIAKISGDLDEINKEKMSGVAFIIAGILFLILIVGLIMIIVGARKISKSNGEMTYLRQQISKIEVDNNKILSEAKKIKE